jgi:DNA-3-methyladenine glycosylase I
MKYTDGQYREIFKQMIETIRNQSISEQLFDSHFDWFKNLSYKTMSDNDIFWVLVYVAFFSGMRASTVSKKLPAIKTYLYDFKKVRDYTEKEIDQILNDPKTIHHKTKIKACIDNAKEFYDILNEYGSFSKYIDSFGSPINEANIKPLIVDLKVRFRYLGERTVYHFLTDLGFNVLKPDRVVCRIFERLSLIDRRDNIIQAVEVGKTIAVATGYPIRCVDIIFVKYGQIGEDLFLGEPLFGLKNGICFEKNPRCFVCGIKQYCNFYAKTLG